MEPIIIGLGILYCWAILRAGHTPDWVYREVMKDSASPTRERDDRPATLASPDLGDNPVSARGPYHTIKMGTEILSHEEQSEAAAAIRRAVRKNRP